MPLKDEDPELTNIGLHLRLKNVEKNQEDIKIDQREIKEMIWDIPEKTALIFAAKHPTRAECLDQHQKAASDVPWGKIAGIVGFVVVTAVAGWLGIPVQWNALPGSPAPIVGAK